MKFVLSLLSLLASAGAALTEIKEIKADSPLGMKVLSKARNLEEWAEFQSAWVAGYSIKFQGCHHISQWNDEAEDEDTVRIITKRLVRFRLCPTQYCSSENSNGCANGFGDYIIDMNSFLEAYLTAKEQEAEYQQQYNQYQYQQDQYQNGGQYDGQNGQNYQYQDGQMNNYQDGQYNYQYQDQDFDIEDYLECQQANIGDRRKLEDYNGQYGGYAYDGEYYMGPYCASQGGAIYLGLFTDDSCSTFADSNGGQDVYAQLSGGMYSMPYGEKNLVDMDCIACAEPGEYDYYNNQNDENDADDVLEYCEDLYSKAGKCEENLPYGTNMKANNNACNYMEGIKIVRKDGTVSTAEAKANRTAGAFIGLLVVAFVALSGYVYFLKTKLDRASINLNDE